MSNPDRYSIARIGDDTLIDFATTCSNRGVALAAEMALRRRYPSRFSKSVLELLRLGRKAQKEPAE